MNLCVCTNMYESLGLYFTIDKTIVDIQIQRNKDILGEFYRLTLNKIKNEMHIQKIH